MIPVVAPSYPWYMNWLRTNNRNPREYRFVSHWSQLQGTTEIIVLDGGSPDQEVTEMVRERKLFSKEAVREEFSK